MRWHCDTNDRMTQKTALVKTRVTPDIRARLEAVAEETGLTVSGLLRVLVENVVDGEAPPAAERLPSRSRREGKVTVRLDKDVRDALDEEARERRVSVSTWAASMIRARYRGGPQPLPNDRPAFQRAFRQLSGVAVNVNQIAHALNRGALTGAGAALTAEEVRALAAEVASLRKELRAVAAGRYQVQVLGDRDE